MRGCPGQDVCNQSLSLEDVDSIFGAFNEGETWSEQQNTH